MSPEGHSRRGHRRIDPPGVCPACSTGLGPRAIRYSEHAIPVPIPGDVGSSRGPRSPGTSPSDAGPDAARPPARGQADALDLPGAPLGLLLRRCASSICEPLFKAYCKQYGRGVRTGVYIHWVQGKGDIILGDDVLIDGKCSLPLRRPVHAPSDSEDRRPLGDRPQLPVQRRQADHDRAALPDRVGRLDVRLERPRRPIPKHARPGLPPSPEDVRPIVIEDNVWIGASLHHLPRRHDRRGEHRRRPARSSWAMCPHTRGGRQPRPQDRFAPRLGPSSRRAARTVCRGLARADLAGLESPAFVPELEVHVRRSGSDHDDRV